MQLLSAFNANDFDPSQTGGSLPVGKHPVIIESSEVKATKAKDGGLLELTLKIIDGPQAGVTGPYRLNLYNNSQQSKDIAHRQLSAICHVTGVYQVNDSSQLHNIPFIIEVAYQIGHEPGSGPDAKGYTEVRKVYDMNGNEPGKNNGNNGQAAQTQQQNQNQNQGNNQQQNWSQNNGQQNNNQNQNQNQNNGGGNGGDWSQNNNNSNNNGNGNNSSGASWGSGNNQQQNNGNNGGDNNASWNQNQGNNQNNGNSNGNNNNGGQQKAAWN